MATANVLNELRTAFEGAEQKVSTEVEKPLATMKATKERALNTGEFDPIKQMKEREVITALNKNCMTIQELKKDLNSGLELIKQVAKQAGVNLNQGNAAEQTQGQGIGFGSS